MRVVFMGTPDFAVPSLQALLENGYEIQSVFTQPDRPAGRGRMLQPSPVKVVARAYGIPVFQPERIRNEENRAILEGSGPDVIVVVAYGQILPGWILRAGRCGAVNVHASLLPRYRGAAPIARAILNGETVTGVTTMLMEETLDSGPILLQHEIPIPLSKTAGELADNLSAVGAKLLLQTLDGLRRNTLTPKIQNENMVSWAPRINKEMAPVSWKRSAGDIHNQIRAMNPWPGAYTSFRGEKLYLWRSMPESPAVRSGKAPGAFLDPSKEGIRVQCGAGTVLELLQVQRAAKKRVSGREFASGARLKAGELIFH